MAEQDFPTLWNLAFYNGYDPNYFYFNSLTKPWPNHDEYNKKAAEIANEANAYLNTLPSFAAEVDGSTILQDEWLKQVIAFMEQAVATEQAAEAAYFKNKLAQLKDPAFKNIPKVQELIKEFDNPGSFNYDNVITLINLIYQGLDNTKAIVKSEKEHIEEIEKGMAQIRGDDETTGRQRTLRGLWNSNKSGALREKYKTYDKFLEASNRKRKRDILIQYTKHGNLSSSINQSKRRMIPGVKKWLTDKNLRSTDAKIGQWITKTVNDIINDQATFNEVTKICLAKYNWEARSNSELEHLIKSYLIKGITAFATKNLHIILNETYNNLDPSELSNLITESINLVDDIQIEGVYDNFGQFGTDLKLFTDANTLQDLLDETRSAEGLYDAYKKFRTELTKLKSNKDKQASDGAKLVRGALHTNTSKDEYKDIYTLIRQLEALKKQLDKYSKNTEKIAKIIDKFNDKQIKVQGQDNETITLRIQLTNDGTVDLAALRSSLKNSKLMEKLGGAGNEAKVLSSFVTALKAGTSRSLKSDILKAMGPLIKYAQTKGLGGEEYVINSIKEALGNVKISVGGPNYSEIKQGIQQSLRESKDLAVWAGKIKKKNDFITVGVNWQVPSFQDAIKESFNTQAENFVMSGEEVIQEVSYLFFKNFQETFYDSIKRLNDDSSTVNNFANHRQAFFDALEKRNKALENANELQNEGNQLWERYAAEARAAGANEEELRKQRQTIIDGIKNSFFVSSTMKTYNQYQNQIGFVGGSLGADLTEQLNNMADIFEQAGLGITQDDMNWLYTAIINCSPVSLIGEKHKNIIEDYLGALAAFALFDEGSAEAKIIHSIQENIKDTYTTPQILHLYAVNGVYHPGSFVLSKVVEELKLCAENAGAAYESTHSGAGITIINTTNEGMIPNRRKGSIPEDHNPWGTVANKAKGAVSLQILFLAGLLDTVHNMDNILGNIELPK